MDYLYGYMGLFKMCSDIYNSQILIILRNVHYYKCYSFVL